MIILDVEQGTPQWLQARLGIPTASRFKDILTPKTRKYSKASSGYRNELVAEWILGAPLYEQSTVWQDHGNIMEPEARRFYEFQTDRQTREVGFVLNDARTIGASPDALVDPDGGVEIKCRGPKAHVGILLDGGDTADMTQVQGNIWICEREWWDVLAYHKGLPHHLERVHRDEEYIADLAAALDQFNDELEEAKEKIRTHGVEGTTEDSLAALLEKSIQQGAAA